MQPGPFRGPFTINAFRCAAQGGAGLRPSPLDPPLTLTISSKLCYNAQDSGTIACNLLKITSNRTNIVNYSQKECDISALQALIVLF